MPHLKTSVFLALFFLCAPAGAAPVVTEAWEGMLAGEARAAEAGFRVAAERGVAGAVSREARVGRAASLLAVQPKTASNLAAARALLESVRAEPERDDWRVLATYLLGRWHQTHAFERDAAEAERLLGELLEGDAGHPWADPAAPKLAMLRLYAGVDRAEFGRRCDRLEILLARVRDAGAARDARLVIADAALRLHADHGRALPHYRAVLAEAEALRPALRARVIFQAAESAAALGEAEEAAKMYRRFQYEFPRDARVAEAGRRAEAAAAGGGGGS